MEINGYFQMIIKYIVVSSVFISLAALVVRLQIVDRREMDRRSKLPLEEQKEIEEEENAWSQGYSF